MIASGGQSVLFLDDLVDSGGTAQALKQLLPRSHIAVVYAKKNSKHLVDSYEVIIPDIWVIFPWEKPMSEFDSHS